MEPANGKANGLICSAWTVERRASGRFVFDLEGRPKGSHVSAYETQFPNPSWAEQDPEGWWRSMGQATSVRWQPEASPPTRSLRWQYRHLYAALKEVRETG